LPGILLLSQLREGSVAVVGDKLDGLAGEKQPNVRDPNRETCGIAEIVAADPAILVT
jgi:hypothetical protein